MAQGDERRVPAVQSNKEGMATSLSINEVLRQFAEMIYQQEGRRGTVTIRDQLRIQAPDRKTPLDLYGPSTFSRACLAFGGPDESSLFVAKGAVRNDNGVWIATDTVAQIIELGRDASVPRIYNNIGLAVGGAFTPTLIGTIASSVDIAALVAVDASKISKTKPVCTMYKVADFSHPTSGTWQKVAVDTVVLDTDSIASVANTRMNIVTPGIYRISGNANFASSAAAQFDVYMALYVDGVASVYSSGRSSTTNSMWMHAAKVLRLNAGQYVELYGYQNSGGALNMYAAAQGLTLAAEWIGS